MWLPPELRAAGMEPAEFSVLVGGRGGIGAEEVLPLRR